MVFLHDTHATTNSDALSANALTDMQTLGQGLIQDLSTLRALTEKSREQYEATENAYSSPLLKESSSSLHHYHSHNYQSIPIVTVTVTELLVIIP